MKLKCILFYLYLATLGLLDPNPDYTKHCRELDDLVDIDFMQREKIELIGEPD